LLGSTTASPVQITHDIVSGNYFGGNICPTDHYCAAGSSYARSCPPGAYWRQAGKFCLNDHHNIIPGVVVAARVVNWDRFVEEENIVRQIVD